MNFTNPKTPKPRNWGLGGYISNQKIKIDNLEKLKNQEIQFLP